MNTVPTYVYVKIINSAGDAQYIRYDGAPKPCGDNRYVKPTLVRHDVCASVGPVPAHLRRLIVAAPE